MLQGIQRLICAVWLCAALPAWANELVLAPSPASQCLSPPAATRGTPEYPPHAWAAGAPGRVLVELIFTGSDLAPEIKIIESEAWPGQAADFIAAVRRHVRELRLPCLEAADIPARVRLDFKFVPNERAAVPPEAVDPDRAQFERDLKCVLPPGGDLPEYSMTARRRGLQGRVLLRMRFTSADGPPEVTVLSRPTSEPFVEGARKWGEGFRMPCFSGRPLVAGRTLVYRLEGENRYGFGATTLMQFIGSVRDIKKQRLDFDFNTMGCPFEVRLQYLQPHARNRVTQVSEQNPARRPFLDWLESADLDLRRELLDSVFADSVVLLVRCGTFKL